MEKAFSSFLLTVLLFLHYAMASSAMTYTNGTTDQLALLSLKSQIISGSFHFLDESWSLATSVCHWAGVTCISRHQRVNSLNLSNMALTGRIPRDFGNLTFLVSLDLGNNNFQGNLPQEMAHLHRLNFLDLSLNNFTGEVPSWFGFLHQLQFLSLRNNSFTGPISSSFSNISTLETLNLKFNSIEGHIPKEIGNFINLRILSLSGNNLIGSIPLSLSNASRLEILNLSNNLLQGNIPEGIGNLHNMDLLLIEFNQLTGSIPFTIFNITRIEVIAFTKNSLSGDLPDGLCNRLPTLKELYLSRNKLHGHMPTRLSNCSELQLLNLSENEFDGPIHNEIGRLSNLHRVFLGYNHFTGMIPQEIKNLVNLVELGMESNQITSSVPISIFNISSLQNLVLAKNNLKGSLPREIGNLTKIQFLYLNENRFTGEIPKEMSSLVKLEELNLEENTFCGTLDMEIFNISGLRTISLTLNNLSGTLPPNIGSILPNIEFLYLGGLTNLVGTIPHSICNCSKLTHLSLASNKLTGLIPNSLGDLTHLQFLTLEQNNLTSDLSLSFLTSLTNCRNLTILSLSLNPLNGMLPISAGNLSGSLIKFYASGCKIKGRIPNEVGNLSNVIDLVLGENDLIGSIPTSTQNLRNLQRLYLNKNKFTGSIGDNLCKLQYLGVIDLTKNQLSGSLPDCLGNITSLREIHLGYNKLSSNIPASIGNLKDLIKLDLSPNNMVGPLPLEIGNLKAATLMDLSMNQFSNGIPREIGGLQNLEILSLRHNKLQGSIPDSMSKMVGLEFLDLSHNNILGTIPMSLEKLQNLKYFNVSVNKLYGEIPSGGPFKSFPSQFFVHNEALCGSSRFSVPPCPTSSKHRSNRKNMLVLFLILGIALVFVPTTLVFVWIRYRRGKSVPQQADSSSIATTRRISYYDLLQATDSLSESNLIGFGSLSSVYKGILRSGTPIAVKVFNQQLDATFKSFDTECELLRSLRHRNLVKVITSCSSLDFKALVLEYMSNGSLEKCLYSHNYFLDIMQRLSIMIDVACALEYLHHGCSLPVIHCDLKPSNVLLDGDMVAHLSDFGISKLLGEDESNLYTKTLATLGYIAPEYGLDGLVSTKCDVYSYGILLMETFTRRKPNDEMFEGDLSLKQWVSNSLPKSVMDVVDANLTTQNDSYLKLDCVASIMEVALDCCVDSPTRRKNMKDVVEMLQKIKIQLHAC
ncbi:probable LRR receptor-like serine/threonine-protein kinase At3g47570 [Capsicum annuum]|uniref:probable LRR receptor-like serine/threonine-protein kinase At3g47570 n=1 Tax=Capsicum annuum TaxID=4072 RepID=UPI001FB1A099|nr:probable LRR receptor-like serine/threonine-protein kinase At3g47570 [Capsicum annuum]